MIPTVRANPDVPSREVLNALTMSLRERDSPCPLKDIDRGADIPIRNRSAIITTMRPVLRGFLHHDPASRTFRRWSPGIHPEGIGTALPCLAPDHLQQYRPESILHASGKMPVPCHVTDRRIFMPEQIIFRDRSVERSQVILARFRFLSLAFANILRMRSRYLSVSEPGRPVHG